MERKSRNAMQSGVNETTKVKRKSMFEYAMQASIELQMTK